MKLELDAPFIEQQTQRIIATFFPGILHTQLSIAFPTILVAQNPNSNPITGESVPSKVGAQISLFDENPKIILYPRTKLRKPSAMAKVLAHEIGHYIDILENPDQIRESQQSLYLNRKRLNALKTCLLISGGLLLFHESTRDLGLRLITIGPLATQITKEALYTFSEHEQRAERFARRFYYNYIPGINIEP